MCLDSANFRHRVQKAAPKIENGIRENVRIGPSDPMSRGHSRSGKHDVARLAMESSTAGFDLRPFKESSGGDCRSFQKEARAIKEIWSVRPAQLQLRVPTSNHSIRMEESFSLLR